jgi:hypothetical protein
MAMNEGHDRMTTSGSISISLLRRLSRYFLVWWRGAPLSPRGVKAIWRTHAARDAFHAMGWRDLACLQRRFAIHSHGFLVD